VRPTLRPLSFQRYGSIIERYIKPQIGAQRLQALSAGHLNAMYAELERVGLSVSTRRRRTSSSAVRCATPNGGGASLATSRALLTRRLERRRAPPRGRPASCADSSTTSKATGCTPCGA
jgi:hypothetical protein